MDAIEDAARLNHVPARSKRRSGLALAIAVAIAAARCTSSTTTTSTDPSPVKCQATLTPASSSVDAAGGTGSVTITTAPECAWNVSANAEWITITSSTSGQGAGKVEFRASANPDVAARHGVISVNSQHFNVDQAGVTCAFTLAQTTQAVPPAGGPGTVSVSTAAPCAWTATSNADWITVTSGASGTGPGTVGFTVASNPGASRSGTLTIGGQTFTVMQAEVACSFSITSANQSAGADGGPGSVGVTAGPGCAWTAMSHDAWITITAGASGTGNGNVAYTVAANTSGSRTGTLTIAGQTLTITQAAMSTPPPPPPPPPPNCSFSLTSTSMSIGAAGGPGSTSVNTTSACAWNAGSNVGWIQNVSPSSQTGPHGVTFMVLPNPGPDRIGSLTIAGVIFTVTQCGYALNPSNQTIAVTGGPAGPVNVTAGMGCGWTATSNMTSWLTVTPPGSGTGNGSFSLFVLANNNCATRSGMITVVTQTFTATQDGFTLSASSQSVPVGGGSFSVTVATASTCTWTITGAPSWIHIISGGTGILTVPYTVDNNTSGSARTATLTIAGHTFTVNQS